MRYPVARVMGLASTISALWLAGLALQAVLLLVIVVKKLWRSFPIFAVYSAVTFAESLAGYGIPRHSPAYFYLYVIGETASLLLGVAVVYEIFKHLFAPHAALRNVATRVFRVVVILLAVLGGAVIAAHAPIGKGAMMFGLLRVEEAARILEVGLIMVLFLCSSAFGLHWRQPVFGIGLGLGTLTTFKLISLAMVPYVASLGDALNLTVVLSLDISFLIWIGYLLVPERAAAHSEVPQHAQLEQWNRAMMELINQ